MPDSDLRPTRARLALLRDVQAGIVVGDDAGEIWRDERLGGFYDPMTATREKVTVRARRLRDAGWIKVHLYRAYQLTDAGHDVLADS